MSPWALATIGALAGMAIAVAITLGVAWVVSVGVPVGPGSIDARLRGVLPVLLYLGPVLLIVLSIVGGRVALRLAERADAASPESRQSATPPDAGTR